MRMKLLGLMALAIITMGGCTTIQNALSHAPTPAQSVAVLDTSYVAAGTLAAQYIALPRCGSQGATVICSDATTVDTIRTLDSKAYATLSAATSAVRTGASNADTYIIAAQAAVSALQTATIHLKGK